MSRPVYLRNCQIRTTSGNDVNLNEIVYGHIRVRDVVNQHQNKMILSNIACVLLWFVGVPVISLVIIAIAVIVLLGVL